MKANKIISLDIDIMERLRTEENASSLINNLLCDYYLTGNIVDEQSIIKAISSLDKEIIDRQEQKNLLLTKLGSIQAKKEAEKGIKRRCFNCKSENLLIRNGNIICMKCGYEENYNETKQS